MTRDEFIHVRLPAAEKARYSDAAARRGLSLSAWLLRAARKELEEQRAIEREKSEREALRARVYPQGG